MGKIDFPLFFSLPHWGKLVCRLFLEISPRCAWPCQNDAKPLAIGWYKMVGSHHFANISPNGRESYSFPSQETKTTVPAVTHNWQ